MKTRPLYALKRPLDIVLSSLVLLFLSPLLLIVAFFVRLSLGAPIFYPQNRTGLHGRKIFLYKFRTMTNARNARGDLLCDADRITALGRFLRKWSLDELPGLWNVLKGDLSLVGPRPLLIRYLNRYSPEQARRLEVVPGITGWAQVNGRNAVDWERKLSMDVWYVDHWSLGLDFKIILMTIWKVLSREDVLEEGGGTFPEFWGTQSPPPGGPLAYPVDQDEELVIEDQNKARGNPWMKEVSP